MRTLRIALLLALTLAVVSPEADAQSRSFADATLKKLGWKIPTQPPYFPPGTTVETLQNWVKTEAQYKQLLPYHVSPAQSFPDAGDLVAPWSFGGKSYPPR